MQSPRNGNISAFIFALIVSLFSASSHGYERQEELPAVEFTGYNVEVSSTVERDLIKAGVWLTDQGKLVNAGLFYDRENNKAIQYGFDTAVGYLTSFYQFWPFVEIGVRFGATTSITNLHAEAYPKAGIAVPLSTRLLLYADYQRSYSSQGRRHDYSAASVGLVWGVE